MISFYPFELQNQFTALNFQISTAAVLISTADQGSYLGKR
jgi:hypothetical protein